MNKNILYLVITAVVVIIGVGGYFVFRNGGSQSNKTPALTNSVSIKNFSFFPPDIKINKGTTVTWKNEDGTTHKIKSDTFESGDLASGESYNFTFENVGTFSYICSIHTSMKGTVTVE